MSQCQPRPPRSQLENRQAANRSTAIVVPALLIGIVGYVTWVVVVLIGGECDFYSMAEQNRTLEKVVGLVERAKQLDRLESRTSKNRKN
jgi:hypothetical protein